VAIEVQLITLHQPDEWRQALQDLPHGYWHSWQASCALQLNHGLPTFLYCCSDTTTGYKAVCVYSERQWRDSVDIFSPAGFSGFVSSGPVRALRDHWQRFVRQRGYVCGYFALHPMLADQSAHDNLHTSNNLYVLDVSNGVDELLRNSNTNVKRSMRAWAKSGLKFVENRELLTDFAVRHYRAFMQQKNASSTALWNDETLRMMCADPAVLIVGVEDEQGLCIVSSFATSPFGSEYLFNINLRNGRQYTAALIFWCAQQLEHMQIQWLNLGGGIKPHDSIAKAKERYRPQCLPFYNAMEIYNQARYRKLCLKAGQSPEDMGGYFPRYRLANNNFNHLTISTTRCKDSSAI
jgi:hypothetical protein